MTKEISGREPDPRIVYADIIRLPHHQSDHHPHMSLYDRAAQFAPFAALTGYEDMVSEEARQVDRRIEPDEEELALLNRKLQRIAGGTSRPVSVTYFIPDPLKAGGHYETVAAAVRRVDAAGRKLILDRKTGIAGSYMEIPLGDILEITGADTEEETGAPQLPPYSVS